MPDPTALTDLRAALLGSSFLYAGAQDDDGQTRTPGWLGAWSAWGRGAASWFSVRADGRPAGRSPHGPDGAGAPLRSGDDVNARRQRLGRGRVRRGEVSLTPARATTARETDLTNTMAAVGGRTALSVRAGRAGRFELALRSDARLTNTAVDAVAGLVGATERTRLVRMMLEGAGVVPLALGGVLTTTADGGGGAALRHRRRGDRRGA